VRSHAAQVHGERYEVKVSDPVPSPHFKRFLPQLACPLALQAVNLPDYRSQHQIAGTKLLVMSAAQVLRAFV